MNDIDISRFCTNTDRPVFALRDLPEEVVAVLFAYYARSPGDLRSTLRRLVADGDIIVPAVTEQVDYTAAAERARAFHEKWVVGFGHSSVADHVVLHLAVEDCSILAAKAIEDTRLAAFTEKSTRAVRFDPTTLVTDIWHTPPGADQQDTDLRVALYETPARRQLQAYADIADEAERRLAARHPCPPSRTPRAHAALIRARACDLCRGLLPAGVPTNVGLTINARSLRGLCSKLLGSEWPELQRIGRGLHEEGLKLAPTLLRHVEPSRHRGGLRSRHSMAVSDHANHLPGYPWCAPRDIPLVAPRSPDGYGEVTLLGHTPDPERTLAAAILAEGNTVVPWSVHWEAAGLPDMARRTIRSYLAGRGPHEAPMRALEHVVFRFEVTADFGAWRDLQRHRMLSATVPQHTVENGFWLHEDMEDLGLDIWAMESLERSRVAVCQLRAKMNHVQTRYLAPLAARVRWIMTVNLRELFHIIELRSRRQGHPSYRRTARDLGDAVNGAMPLLRDFLRIDRGEYPFSEIARG